MDIKLENGASLTVKSQGEDLALTFNTSVAGIAKNTQVILNPEQYDELMQAIIKHIMQLG